MNERSETSAYPIPEGETSLLRVAVSYWRWRWSRPRRFLADGGSFLLAVAAGTAAAVAILLEVLVEMPVAGFLYGLVGGTLLAWGAVVVAPDPSRPRILATAAGLAGLGLLFVVLYAVPWSSRKPFVRDLGRIEAGMTRAEVEEIMAGYLRGTNWPASPFGGTASGGRLTDVASGTTYATTRSADGKLAFQGSLVFRHSEDERFNSDWGVVRFAGDRVLSVEFLPD